MIEDSKNSNIKDHKNNNDTENSDLVNNIFVFLSTDAQSLE